MNPLNNKQIQVWKKILLPGGEVIALANTYADGSYLSLHDINHNIFRLNARGEVVWQVRRDDSNHPPDWWDNLNKHARERGLDGAREPFMYMTVEHADGYVDRNTDNRMPKDIQTWVPNSKIVLEGSAYQVYELDPDTGIATNVTKWPVRPW